MTIKSVHTADLIDQSVRVPYHSIDKGTVFDHKGDRWLKVHGGAVLMGRTKGAFNGGLSSWNGESLVTPLFRFVV